MKNILIAGGAGYIGTRMSNEFSNYYNVTVVDHFWFGDQLDKKITRIKKDIFDLVVDDVKGYDAIIFLGGLSNDPMANFRPDLNFVGNSSVPVYLAYIAKQAGIRRFICASSCSVYGFTNNQVLSEGSQVKPAYPYGISKLQCELGISILEDDTFRPILFRKGTVGGYSQKMRYDLVINTMIMTALTTGKIIANNKNLWRPLIDIRDVIEGYRLAVESDQQVTGIFNLSGQNYTIGELGEIVTNELQQRGYNVNLELYENPDSRNYKVSIRKMREAFGYEPKYTPSDSVGDIFNSIDFNNYDFTDSKYYNINTFKNIVS